LSYIVEINILKGKIIEKETAGVLSYIVEINILKGKREKSRCLVLYCRNILKGKREKSRCLVL